MLKSFGTLQYLHQPWIPKPLSVQGDPRNLPGHVEIPRRPLQRDSPSVGEEKHFHSEHLGYHECRLETLPSNRQSHHWDFLLRCLHLQ